MTLDSSGAPKIWEILADASSAKLIFVSQTIEAAALEQSGPPLPGRRYGVERRIEDCPNIVVPRVIEDGPAVMGPIVYLSADTRSVTTVICSCMPAQARQLASTINYRLVPFDGSPFLLSKSKTSRREPNLLWFESGTTGSGLQKMLRLPSSF